MSRKTHLIAAAVFAGMAAFSIGEAHAGVPIPCTGEKIIKLAEFPPELHSDWRHVDLGYIFKYCFNGEFAGYIGVGKSYIKFNEEMQESLRAMNMPAPGFWSAAWNNKGVFWVEWTWLALSALLGGALLKNKLLHGTFAHPQVIAQREAASAAATQSAATSTTTASASVAATRMARVVTPSASTTGATPSFGRR